MLVGIVSIRGEFFVGNWTRAEVVDLAASRHARACALLPRCCQRIKRGERKRRDRVGKMRSSSVRLG